MTGMSLRPAKDIMSWLAGCRPELTAVAIARLAEEAAMESELRIGAGLTLLWTETVRVEGRGRMFFEL